MKLVLKQDKEGLMRVWVNDKKIDDCKIATLRIDISAKEKLLEVAFNLDNFSLEDEVDFLPIIMEPTTSIGIERLEKLGKATLQKAEELRKRLANNQDGSHNGEARSREVTQRTPAK